MRAEKAVVSCVEWIFNRHNSSRKLCRAFYKKLQTHTLQNASVSSLRFGISNGLKTHTMVILSSQPISDIIVQSTLGKPRSKALLISVAQRNADADYAKR